MSVMWLVSIRPAQLRSRLDGGSAADMPTPAPWQDVHSRGDLWGNKEDLQLMPVSARRWNLLRWTPQFHMLYSRTFPSLYWND